MLTSVLNAPAKQGLRDRLGQLHQIWQSEMSNNWMPQVWAILDALHGRIMTRFAQAAFAHYGEFVRHEMPNMEAPCALESCAAAVRRLCCYRCRHHRRRRR